MAEWKSLDTAPRKDEAGNPVPIILFLPCAWHKKAENAPPHAPPAEIAHAHVVGWWSEQQQGWITGIHWKSGGAFQATVYPSLWCELPPEPELPK
jgi:hypothetical protein